MRKIYEHIDFSRVGHYQSILESAGISTHLKNLGAAMASGEIPFVQCFPELWVVEDADYDRALDVLRPYHDRAGEDRSNWTCPSCGEAIEGTFGQCWNCETMRPVAVQSEKTATTNGDPPAT